MAFFFLRENSDATEQPNDDTSRQIKEFKSSHQLRTKEAHPESKKDYSGISNWDLRHLKDDETNGLSQAQLDYWKRYHPYPPPDPKQPKAARGKYAIFQNKADNEIACVLATEPGTMIIGNSDLHPGFAERFLRSIKNPIIVEEQDSDYDKELKKAVRAAKIELKDAYDRGEDIEKLMNESRAELKKLGRYKAEIEKMALMQISKGDTTSADAEITIAAVNKMLESKGIAPIELNSMSRLALKYQSLATKENYQ